MRGLIGKGFRSGCGAAAPQHATYAKLPVAAMDYTATVDSARQTLSARFSLLLRDWSSTSVYQPGGSQYVFAQQVRALNPDIKLVYYLLLSQINTASGGTLYSQFTNTLNNGGGSRSWYTTTGGSTTQKTNYDPTNYPGVWEVNQTSFTAADAQGRHWPQAAADIYATTFRPIFSAGLMDGVMNDNTWYAPRPDQVSLGGTACGDINLDGANEAVSGGKASSTTISAAYRQGYADFWAELRTNLPGLKISANTDACNNNGRSDIGYYHASIDTAELRGKCDYPLLEGFIGKNYSPESLTFDKSMTWLSSAISAKTADGWVLPLCYIGNSATNSAGAYRMARYGFGIAALRDKVMPMMGDAAVGSHTPYYCDDFDQLLGEGVEPEQTAARTGVDGYGVNWGSLGLYARRRQGGIVIVNPIDNKGGWLPNIAGIGISRNSSGVVTLTATGLGSKCVNGDLVKLEETTFDTSLAGIFSLTVVDANTIRWTQGNTTPVSYTSGQMNGWLALQTTLDLTGKGYKRFATTMDAHNNYNGTIGAASPPVYTSQNDGSTVTTVKLWAQDALILLNA